jgi:hypothetical protein
MVNLLPLLNESQVSPQEETMMHGNIHSNHILIAVVLKAFWWTTTT